MGLGNTGAARRSFTEDDVIINSLNDTLNDSDTNVRCAAVKALVRIAGGYNEPGKYVMALLEAAQKNPNNDVRNCAIEALRNLREPSSLRKSVRY